jgi:hypothetical protein
MATADPTVIGLGRSEVSASPYIAEIQRRLAAQDRVRSRSRGHRAQAGEASGGGLALVVGDERLDREEIDGGRDVDRVERTQGATRLAPRAGAVPGRRPAPPCPQVLSR